MDELERYLLAVEYIEGWDERVVREGELALIYSVLPEVLVKLVTEGI